MPRASFFCEGTTPRQTALSSRFFGILLSGVPMTSLMTSADFWSLSISFPPSAAKAAADTAAAIAKGSSAFMICPLSEPRTRSQNVWHSCPTDTRGDFFPGMELYQVVSLATVREPTPGVPRLGFHRDLRPFQEGA